MASFVPVATVPKQRVFPIYTLERCILFYVIEDPQKEIAAVLRSFLVLNEDKITGSLPFQFFWMTWSK